MLCVLNRWMIIVMISLSLSLPKVSSFASESDKEMNWKVLMRIKNICSLQDKLKSLLTGTCVYMNVH